MLRGVAFRSRVLGMPYADQALFIRRSHFETLGGYRDLPFMEDHEMVQRLKRTSIFNLLDAQGITSPRRWEQSRQLRMTVVNQLSLLAFTIGVPSHLVARFYEWVSRST